MASTLGQYNPLRYRGYVYDQETALYYLQSRYYNPETGRFLNADAFASTGQGLLGNNMFAYCGNSPVMRVDPTGRIFGIIPMIPIIIPAFVIANKINESKTEDTNNTHNSILDSIPSSSTENNIIYNQKDVKGFKYGAYYMDYNGCEVIAVHNAKCLLGKYSTLSRTVRTFRESGAIWMNGALGSKPNRIGDVLDMECIPYVRVKEDQMVMKGVYIMSYWTGTVGISQIHTVAICYDGTTYTAYNYNGGAKPISPETFSDSFICGYYLGG